MEELLEFLSRQASGPISEIRELEPLLEAQWHAFEGCDEGGMDANKLRGRVEEPTWNPPFLEFLIERHGATVLGSTRAELQRWRLDVVTRTAEFDAWGHRQARPKQEVLNLDAIVRELSELIETGLEHNWLRWAGDGTVTIRIGQILPKRGQSNQTVNSRRKRLRHLLEVRLATTGWRPVRPNTFAKDKVK